MFSLKSILHLFFIDYLDLGHRYSRIHLFLFENDLLLCVYFEPNIGGQPRFRSMWERYCRGVNAIVYVSLNIFEFKFI